MGDRGMVEGTFQSKTISTLTMILYLRWIVGVALFAVFIWVSILNARVFWKRHIQKKESPSWIPLLGGGCGSVALLLLPQPAAHPWWWLTLVVDWGSLPGIAYSAVYHKIGRA